MGCLATVYGNLAADLICSSGYEIHGRTVTFTDLEPPLVLEALEPFAPGRKVVLTEPLSLANICRLGGQVVPGGGGFGTAASLAHALNCRVLYVDASRAGDMFSQHFARLGIEPLFLGLREVPVNVVLGRRADKEIGKSPVPPVRLTPEQAAAAAAGLEPSEWVVINSVKDEDLALLALAARARSPRTKVAAVVTRSLPYDFVRAHLFPAADLLVVAFDEMEWLLSHMPATITGSKERLLALRRETAARSIFVTLGPRGVLAAGDQGVYHVLLKSRPARAVEAAIGDDAARLRGAGDHFTGGLIGGCCGRPSLPQYPRVVAEAIAGSIAAVHHLGTEVGPDDFEVHEDSLCEMRDGEDRRRRSPEKWNSAIFFRRPSCDLA